MHSSAPVHDLALVQDLALILVAAAVVTILFSRLKQPIVLGYLIAGFLVGPHFNWLPTVKGTENISIWAEIGVIFMLFGLGLEFSFKKLGQVGKSASMSALSEVVFMIALGYSVGQLLGWSQMDSLFMGAVLSVSSTTIIVKAFEELGLKGKNFVTLTFGVLIVEDLISILLLVFLSSIAITQSLSGSELLFTSSKFAFFLALWFLLGIYLLPTLLTKIRSYLSNETILVVAIGLCFMMVFIATEVGFSAALGAFVMGSLFAETQEGHRIEKIILPVKDLFSAVFFVSVGMLIDPAILVEHFWVIILLTLITIFGKLVSSGFGALVSGRSLKTSIQAGMSLAQIGEFSFLIAMLGKSLNVTSDFIYPITIAVSAVTTFTTPYTIKFSEPLSDWVEGRLPKRVQVALKRYEAIMSTSSNDTSFLKVIWKSYGVLILMNLVLVIAATLLSSKILYPYLHSLNMSFIEPVNLWLCLLTLVMVGPFLWAIVLRQPKDLSQYGPEMVDKLNKLQVGFFIVRLTVGGILIAFIVSNFTSLATIPGFVLLGFVVAAALLSKFSEPLYKKIEARFLSNLTEHERIALAKKAKTPDLAPWNIELSAFELSPHSPLITKTLQNSKLKENYGVTVTMIERGSTKIIAPLGNEILLPYDKLSLIGTEEQLSNAVKEIEYRPETVSTEDYKSYGLTSLILHDEDQFVGKTIRDSGIREVANGLIVGLERDGTRILSPNPSTTLQAEDLIWLVGDLTKIKTLRKTVHTPQ
ncbi:MAG: cation:proton antiporter [Bdellovibrionaceae bacterium]|nr:cation:proton antiporter [Pseudobdellovibrionaceae bacterium]